MMDVAMFGAGRIGKIHAGNVARQPGVRLRYVVDVDAEAARSLAQQHGARSDERGSGVRRQGASARWRSRRRPTRMPT